MLKGTIIIPGDKSITHRAIIFASLAAKTSKIIGALLGEDCLATIACFQQLGVNFTRLDEQTLVVESPGVANFHQPQQPIDCQNSGTTARLMMGILAALPFESELIGDASLNLRPMRRVVEPLTQMGAAITLTPQGTLPAKISGRALRAITYTSPVASAQVKSAILLAGLFASGETIVHEPEQSRDHTERFCQLLGYPFTQLDSRTVSVQGKLHTWNFPDVYQVPGDISSAAFWLVAASIIPGSKLTLQNVGLNPTRTGILEVLMKMGANLVVKQEQLLGEPSGTIVVRPSQLQAVEIKGEIIPRLIDELPIIALAATQASGQTVIADAQELRVKETDRITQTANVLQQLGAKVEPTTDGLKIIGPTQLIAQGAYSSFGDHRLAMLLLIAEALLARPLTIAERQAYTISYPEFEKTLNKLQNH
ncbi:MAG: 3-phosphoshikimate 1-carboxyvinyltransferase [Culicoidibacterales bacterium]